MKMENSEKSIKNKKILTIILSVICICLVAYILLNRLNNNKLFLPIYECTNRDYSSSKVTVTSQNLEEYERRSDKSLFDCKLISNYDCKYDKCFLSEEKETSFGKYALIYDNNENNDGGYYIFNSNNKKVLSGPYYSVKFYNEGRWSSGKVITQGEKNGKYGLFSLNIPYATKLYDFEFDSINEYGIVIKKIDNELKYGAISTEEKDVYIEANYDYINHVGNDVYILKKDDKYYFRDMNYKGNSSFEPINKAYDYINAFAYNGNANSVFDKSNFFTEYCVVYIDQDKLHIEFWRESYNDDYNYTLVRATERKISYKENENYIYSYVDHNNLVISIGNIDYLYDPSNNNLSETKLEER